MVTVVPSEERKIENEIGSVIHTDGINAVLEFVDRLGGLRPERELD